MLNSKDKSDTGLYFHGPDPLNPRVLCEPEEPSEFLEVWFSYHDA